MTIAKQCITLKNTTRDYYKHPLLTHKENFKNKRYVMTDEDIRMFDEIYIINQAENDY